MEQMSFNNFFEQLDSLNNSELPDKVIYDVALDEVLNGVVESEYANDVLKVEDELESANAQEDLTDILAVFGCATSTLVQDTVTGPGVSVKEVIIENPTQELEVTSSVIAPDNIVINTVVCDGYDNKNIEVKSSGEVDTTIKTEDYKPELNILSFNDGVLSVSSPNIMSSLNSEDDLFSLSYNADTSLYSIGYSKDIELPMYVFDFEEVNSYDEDLVKQEDDVVVVPKEDIQVLDKGFVEVGTNEPSKIINSFNEVNKPAEAKNKPSRKVSRYKGHNLTKENLSRTPVARFEDNVNALTKLADLQSTGKSLTKADADILAKYSGWGGLGDFFEDKNPRNAELRKLLGKGYEDAMYSVTSAYYTPAPVIRFMYSALKRLGFHKGKILECSIGSGRYFSFMNKSIYEQSKLYGVELDETSSKIASLLHPKAKIVNCGFEKTTFEDDEFDLCISNIPFGDLLVFDNQDKELNKHKLRIHDYFFLKALKKVRPGGIVAFVTSAGFMDKNDSKARQILSKECELLGVIRLPNTTFIGTNVVADIVFLRKTSEPKCRKWNAVKGLKQFDEKFGINEFLYAAPELIAGTLAITSTQFGEGLTVNGVALDDESFKKYLKYLPSSVYIQRTDESYLYEEDEVIEDNAVESLEEYEHHPWIKDLRDDEYVCIKDELYKKQSNKLIKQTNLSENRYSLIKRYALVKGAVLDIRTNPDATDAQLEVMQAVLNKYYEDFVSHHGNTADPKHRSILGTDHVGYPLFLALENVEEIYDEATDSLISIYSKADIFSSRVVGKSYKIEDPKTLQEAIVLSFYLSRKLDLHLMSERLNRDIDSVIADCLEEGLIYYDFSLEKYEEASEFLSGYVKDKLNYNVDLLERIKNGNNIVTVPTVSESFLSSSESSKWCIPHLERNIAALKENQPDFVDDVEFEFSSTWIPIEIKEKFIFNTLEIKDGKLGAKLVYDESLGYSFKYSCSVNSVLLNSEWGTSRVKATRVLEHSLNETFPEVTDTVDGKTYTNVEESQMAMTMVKKWSSSFREYVLNDPDLHLDLVHLYNEIFNRIKGKKQTNFILDAQTNPAIKPREHQLKAASRICTSKNSVLLYHQVGTGKTFTMQISAHMLYKMRMYAEGRPNKSMFVVPNSLCLSGQFAREYLTIYPDANILALTPDDFEKKNRRKVLSKIATNNWEAVIIPHSVLNMIPMKEETLKRLYEEDIRDMERALLYFEEGQDRMSVFKMQKLISKRKAKMDELLDIHKDEFSIYWEDLGIDTLYVDEAHNFKSLYFVTKKDRVAGINTNASKQASNLHNIVRYQREKDPASIIFSTATPISNTVGELFNFSRYLNPEGLKKHGVYEFDAWSSTFGSIVNEVEADVTGQNFKVKPRFAKFFNTPELMTIVKEFADVVFTEDVAEIKVPKLITGQPIDIEIKPTELMLGYIDELVERVGKFETSSGEEKKKDNMLKICGDGRKLALAPKLVGIDEASPKVRAVVENVYKVYRDHPEGTQLIFCDIGTPDDKGGYSVYQEVKEGLIDKGMLETEVAFIHDCGSSPVKREALIKKFNDGLVKVLLGSTAKMGEGVNLQKRVKALHHIDAPWRPSDVQQREGRILRHGNENEEVYIFRYLVKNSFDVFSWQSATRS